MGCWTACPTGWSSADASASWAIYDVCIGRYVAAAPDFSLSGKRVAVELDQLIVMHGKPKLIGSDNGTELTSNAILTCTADSGVDRHYFDSSLFGTGA